MTNSSRADLITRAVTCRQLLQLLTSGSQAARTETDLSENHNQSGKRYLREQARLSAERWRVFIRRATDGAEHGRWVHPDVKPRFRELVELTETLAVYAADQGLVAKPLWDLIKDLTPLPDGTFGPDELIDQCYEIAMSVINDAPPAPGNEARDKWMYEQKKAGATLSEIKGKLNRDHTDWFSLETTQAVSTAIKRYCERHDLERP